MGYLYYRLVISIMFFWLVSCHQTISPVNGTVFSFGVFDVGQGLSQIGIVGDRAIFYDVGSSEQYAKWRQSYNALGAPYIECIVLSHSDLDHCGALQAFEMDIPWSGDVVVSCREDTAYIRSICSESWQSRIQFKVVQRGDTSINLPGVRMECLWPLNVQEMRNSTADNEKNFHSLVFKLTHGDNSILVTSDIDTIAQRYLSFRDGYHLTSNIAVVPHHGSRDAVDPVFWGYVGPEEVIISCARDNPYNHPSSAAVLLFMRMDVRLWTTFNHGSVIAKSNGHYWLLSSLDSTLVR